MVDHEVLPEVKDEGLNFDLMEDRLKFALSGESVNSFAKKCGLSESLLRKYLSGATPGLDKAVTIAKAAKIELLWLATGEGECRLGGEAGGRPQSIEDEFAMIPGYNIQVSAGAGSFPYDETPTRKLAFRHKWLSYRGLSVKDLVLVFAKGDSMEPTISDNNTLMVDMSQKDLKDGLIYVIRTDGHLIVKRVQRTLNGLLLMSDNKAYKDLQLNHSEEADLNIIGRVVWLGRDL